MRRAAVLLLGVLSATGGAVHGDPLDDLLAESLPVRKRFVLGGLGLLSTGGGRLETVPAGRWTLEATWVVTNTFTRSPAVGKYLRERGETRRLSLAELRAIEQEAEPGLFVADGEFTALELTLRRGLRPGLEVGATLSLAGISGGTTDSLKRWIDESLGISLNGRDRLTSHGFLFYLRRPDGEETYMLEAPGTGLGDLRLALLWQLPLDSRRWAASLQLVAELPVGDAARLHGSGSTDLAVDLTWARRSGRRRLVGHLGVTRLGPHTFLGTGPTSVLSYSLGYRLPLGRRWATTLRWYTAESLLPDYPIGSLAEPSSFLELELVRIGDGGTSWHLGLSDNLPFLDLPLSSSGTGSDFAIQFGARHVLQGRRRPPAG